MAYDEFLAERINQILTAHKADFFAKKMMGGLVFMMNEKMLCGIHFDKKKQTDLLMARIGEAQAKIAIEENGGKPMDFTGRPMKGYVFLEPHKYDLDTDLEHWIQQCINFNPEAPKSKKKKPKKKE